MYHRFGESDYPSTSIRIDQFEAHIAELKSGRYTVLPVPEILAALREGRELPDRTVGITVDDAYLSVYTEAFPRLREAGLPFTLFVATRPVDRGLDGFMTWKQIRELAASGVTIGSQSHTHPHMPLLDRSANRNEIETANERFEAELGTRPTLFAYPFGEASAALRDLVRRSGFVAAFGQHSGVVHRSSDRYYLPRFALNERYGKIGRFRLIVNALPLPVRDLVPADPLLGANPPPFGFTVDESVTGLERLNCYHAKQGRLRIERLGTRRIEVRFKAPFPAGRARVNCTMPGPEGRWRWFGIQFYVKPG